MARSQSPDMRRSALLLRLGIDEQKAFAYPDGSRKREDEPFGPFCRLFQLFILCWV